MCSMSRASSKADLLQGTLDLLILQVTAAGAVHGYALPDRDIHDKRAANRDWELIFEMFRRQLSA